MGDKVYIRQMPDVHTFEYKIGMKPPQQRPERPPVELLIDQGEGWNIALGHVDRAQMDVDFQANCIKDAAEKLKVACDRKFLSAIYLQASAYNKGATAGKSSASLNLGAAGSPFGITKANILDKIVDVNTVLDEANVPADGRRWIVIPAIFAGLLLQSDLRSQYIVGDGKSVVREGRGTSIGKINDMHVYTSNLLPKADDGGNMSYHCIAGHPSGVSWASQVNITEEVDNPDDYGKLLRGLKVYGFKANYPEALVDLYAYKA